MHEASLYQANCFVTLTYAPEHLPAGGNLQYRDFQLFVKRLRSARRYAFLPSRISGVQPVHAAAFLSEPARALRFFMCGEYGTLNLRPHYHACLFNVDFSDSVISGKSAAGEVFLSSPTLSKLWPFGRAVVQDLNIITAAYCARYVVDKVTGPDAEAHYQGRTPEFCRCSLKPGIGAEWFEKFGETDCMRHDFVVESGNKLAPPRYYDRLRRRTDKTVRQDEWEFARELRARAVLGDNTDERLRVREVVHQARVRNQKRELE